MSKEKKTKAKVTSKKSKTSQTTDTQPDGEVDLELWRGLYEAAIAFRDAAPWAWMGEHQRFAVRHPQSNETGYLTILGELGEHRALVLYRGEEGFAKHIDFVMQDIKKNSSDVFQLVEIPLLSASFVDRNELDDQDRSIITALGLSIRGRGQWPLFRRQQPGYLDWYLNTYEVQWLTWGLQQALEVALRAKAQPNSISFWPNKKKILVRTAVETEGQIQWQDTWEPCEGPELPAPYASLPARLIAALQQVPRLNIDVEVDFFPLPVRFRDSRTPPLRTYQWLAVDGQHGLVLGFELVTVEDMTWEETLAHLAGKILKHVTRTLGGLPSEIAVSSFRLARLFLPVCQHLDIELSGYDELPNLEEAKRSMLGWI